MATRGDASGIQPPSMFLTAMELLRSPFEAMSLMILGASSNDLARGDGHPVLVLPGFATDDNWTFLLRQFLEELGHDVHPWGLGWNLDHRTTGADGERVARRIRDLRDATGRTVSLVGWSLGGVIAREAARRDPEDVRQVITLASPFGGNPGANRIRLLYEQLTGNDVNGEAARSRFARGHMPLGIPATSIFSRSDGMVPWENCQAGPAPLVENVEVHSSHIGMVVNPAVFHVVADRLAQPEGQWKPYVPPATLRPLFVGA